MRFSSPFLVIAIRVFFTIYRIETIIRNGKCYEGKINSYSMYGVYKNTEIRRSNRKRIVLKIQYEMKKTHFCHAVGYVQNPNKALSSPICNVYIYGNMYFVSDFKLRKKNEPMLVIPRDN